MSFPFSEAIVAKANKMLDAIKDDDDDDEKARKKMMEIVGTMEMEEVTEIRNPSIFAWLFFTPRCQSSAQSPYSVK